MAEFSISLSDWLLLGNFIVWATVLAVLALFFLSSIQEREHRAGVLTGMAMIGWSILMLAAFFWISPIILTVVSVIASLAALFYFVPLGKTESLQVGTVTGQVDERDIMFAREEYLPGTKKQEEYYARRPELRELDDTLRALPELFAPGGKFYDKDRSEALDEIFQEIERLTTEVDGEVYADITRLSPVESTRMVRRTLAEAGADQVGVAELNQMWVYSYVGRGPEPWGEKIVNHHKYVICFTLEMDFEMVQGAPGLSITEETARRYLDGSCLATNLATKIRQLGYPARAHVAGSNYQIMLPPAAADAGLGELSRMGYLINPRLGGRVRLGAVTTDLPLLVDQPTRFGVQDFCEKCLKCADNCPSRAIPSGPKTDQRGVMKWQLNIEQCLRYWRTAGTDCGLCMKLCPFSHPPTLIHELVKQGIKRSSVARTLSVWGDRLLYGKRPPISPR